MPPASPDSPVGRARGPVEAGRSGAGASANASANASVDASVGSSAGASAGVGALETLLVDLGPRLRRGSALEARLRGVDGDRTWLASGVPELDARLGGGFPVGRLSEICGPPSSGRTALALSLLAGELARGGLAAWVDPADAFDPASAAEALAKEAGGLERLLWVRARTEREALRSCERLLRTEGFGLVVLDCVRSGRTDRPPPGPARRRRADRTDARRPSLRDSDWLRLARLAASARTALVTLSDAPLTGARAELLLELRPRGPRFLGPPGLLDALETTAVLRRHRSRPTGGAVPFSIGVGPGVEPTPSIGVGPGVEPTPPRDSC